MFLHPEKTHFDVNCELRQNMKFSLYECDEIRELLCCSLIFDIIICIIKMAAAVVFCTATAVFSRQMLPTVTHRKREKL